MKGVMPTIIPFSCRFISRFIDQIAILAFGMHVNGQYFSRNHLFSDALLLNFGLEPMGNHFLSLNGHQTVTNRRIQKWHHRWNHGVQAPTLGKLVLYGDRGAGLSDTSNEGIL